MKLKVKGACSVHVRQEVGGTLHIIIKAAKSAPNGSERSIPIALQQQINFCSNAQELMALLFATPAKSEAVMAAFDRKLEELEGKEQNRFHHPKNLNSNGSTTSIR